MPEKKSNRLAGLVKGATGDLVAEAPIRRGRGLEGLLSDEPSPSPLGAQQPDTQTPQHSTNQAPQEETKLTSQQVNNTTSQQVNNQTNQQASNPASQQASNPARQAADTQRGKDEASRTVKSYRIRADLAYRIDVLAAVDRRKIYEVIEEALELYLEAREQERPRQG
jgi:hypothetical protein